MERFILLQELKNLLTSKVTFDKWPISDIEHRWLGRAASILREAGLSDHEMSNANRLCRNIPTTSTELFRQDYAQELLGMLYRLLADLELVEGGASEKIYQAGEAYAFYRDLKEIVAAALSSVFIVDPYADDDVFDLYLSKCKVGVQVRFLTANPTNSLKAVMEKFSRQRGVKFESRRSLEIHDRVIFVDEDQCFVLGQSIKDAAKKKPTYILPLSSVTDMKNLYEQVWGRATTV